MSKKCSRGEGGEDVMLLLELQSFWAVFTGSCYLLLIPPFINFRVRWAPHFTQSGFSSVDDAVRDPSGGGDAAAIISLQTAAIMVHKLLTRQPRLPSVPSSDGTILQFQESIIFSRFLLLT